MQLSELKAHLDGRLDKIEDSVRYLDQKLDNHLERISKAEASIEWIRGHLKVSVSILIAALIGMAGALYNYLVK